MEQPILDLNRFVTHIVRILTTFSTICIGNTALYGFARVLTKYTNVLSISFTLYRFYRF